MPMMTVRTLINQLDEQSLHYFDIAFYKKVEVGSTSDYIFEGYVKGKSKSEILDSINNSISANAINEAQYKIAERAIYKELLNWYELKAQNSSDYIPSEIFYAIYQNEEGSDSTKELENLFHKLKKNKVEYISVELLKKLRSLNHNTQLEAVYDHLYNKYKKQDRVNQKARTHFENLNEKLRLYCKNSNSPQILKSMIVDYKMIRSLEQEHSNEPIKVFLKLSRLILICICNQNQLMKDNLMELNDLMKECKESISNLAFSVEKYFLQNIFDQLSIYQGIYDIDDSVIKDRFERISNRQRDAYNFGFPTDIYRKIQRHVFHKSNEDGSKLIQFYNWKDFGMNELLSKTQSVLHGKRGSIATMN